MRSCFFIKFLLPVGFSFHKKVFSCTSASTWTGSTTVVGLSVGRIKLFLGVQGNIYDRHLLGKVCREAYDTLSAAPERKQNPSSTGTTAETPRDWQQADSSWDTGWQQRHRGSPGWQWDQSASSRYKRSDQRWGQEEPGRVLLVFCKPNQEQEPQVMLIHRKGYWAR